MLEVNNIKQKSIIKKKKKSSLYLSDKQPLTVGGKIA